MSLEEMTDKQRFHVAFLALLQMEARAERAEARLALRRGKGAASHFALDPAVVNKALAESYERTSYSIVVARLALANMRSPEKTGIRIPEKTPILKPEQDGNPAPEVKK